ARGVVTGHGDHTVGRREECLQVVDRTDDLGSVAAVSGEREAFVLFVRDQRTGERNPPSAQLAAKLTGSLDEPGDERATVDAAAGRADDERPVRDRGLQRA